MVRIVKTEFYKLKRYHILWAGVALMLLSVLLTLFTHHFITENIDNTLVHNGDHFVTPVRNKVFTYYETNCFL